VSQITGAVTGLNVVARPAGADDHDDEALTPVEQLAHRVITRMRSEQPKAALAAAVDLVNLIARDHGLTGGAFL
jgi:hypothetical protein